MDKQAFLRLLQNYLDGNVTEEQKTLIEAYYLQFEQDPTGLESLEPYQLNELRNDIKDNLWNRLALHREPEAPLKWYRSAVFRVAAAVVLAVSVLGWIYFSGHPSELDRAGVAVQQEPRKENSVVFLPDGSKVILSTGSKLNYPSTFNGLKKREVFLTGEAFFDIVHNPSMPFLVHTENLTTEVLGTAFNVKANAIDGEIKITVTRGKVKVKEKQRGRVLGILTPSQQIVVDKRKIEPLVQTNVDTIAVTSWKKEDLFCNNLTILEVADLLSERYNTSVTVADEDIQSQRFTTTFNKSETLENILKSICEFNHLQYNFVGKEKVIVYAKRTN